MARFLLEQGVLFQHIPRTGGTWIEKAIDCCGIKRKGWFGKNLQCFPRKHSLLGHYHRCHLAKVNTVVAFVRHPISYYESVWKWLMDNRNHPLTRSWWTWHPHLSAMRWFRAVGSKSPGSFDDWVYMMTTKEPMWCTRLFEAYVGPPGGEIVDWIGRTETLTDDFRSFMTEVGYGEEVESNWQEVTDLGCVNAGTAKPLWSPDMKSRVLESERSIIDRFYAREGTRRKYARLAQRDSEGVAVS